MPALRLSKFWALGSTALLIAAFLRLRSPDSKAARPPAPTSSLPSQANETAMNNSVRYWAQLSLLDKRIDFNQVGVIQLAPELSQGLEKVRS
jgi:hypothetical protein